MLNAVPTHHNGNELSVSARCFLGLGSNLGDPCRQVEAACRALAVHPDICLTRVSSLYRSAPMGPSDQPDYVNAVAEVHTRLPAVELLAVMLFLEKKQGRIRNNLEANQKNGPRTLDLDLLLYGDQVICRPGLRVPHPGLVERDFVLFPLHEIAPRVRIPGVGPIDQLLGACRRHDLQRIGPMQETRESSGPQLITYR